MAITGAALIALGIICMNQPLATLISLAWIIGLGTLISGISTFCNWVNIRKYFPQSGSILVSSLLQILIGILFLKHDLALASILPLFFAFYLIFEGINLAIRSFDYKKVGFGVWWMNLILGIASTVLGFLSLSSPIAGGTTLSIFLGIGFISVGAVYLVALFAVNRFVKTIKSNPWIDEQ